MHGLTRDSVRVEPTYLRMQCHGSRSIVPVWTPQSQVHGSDVPIIEVPTARSDGEMCHVARAAVLLERLTRDDRREWVKGPASGEDRWTRQALVAVQRLLTRR